MAGLLEFAARSGRRAVPSSHLAWLSLALFFVCFRLWPARQP